MLDSTIPAVAGSPSVLWKAFDVLGAFAGARRPLTLSELSRRSGLPKSTTHRIVLMLLEVKAVERVGQGYRMGLRMFAMGACSAEVGLRNIALPHLEQLRRTTRQTVHLAVSEGHDAVYLEKLSTPAPSCAAPKSPAHVGGRIPAHTTGVGKALLAYADDAVVATLPLTARTTATISDYAILQQQLRQVRNTGYALDREETVRGLACVAVPIHVGGQAVAALSVAFTSADGSGALLVGPLRECAAHIGRDVAAHPAEFV